MRGGQFSVIISYSRGSKNPQRLMKGDVRHRFVLSNPTLKALMAMMDNENTEPDLPDLRD